MTDFGDAIGHKSGDRTAGDARAHIARLEVENGLRQYDAAMEMIRYYLDPERPFALRPGLILELQQVAVDGIEPEPGKYRSGPVKINKSQHSPPGAHLVPSLVQELCDYVNDNFHEKTPLHLAAYVMWRLNWIHPFGDGNGRTSRMASYVVLCCAMNLLLPGSPTIPQQIQEDRTLYFRALEAADKMARDEGLVDLSVMEESLRNMLANQLMSVINRAAGGI